MSGQLWEAWDGEPTDDPVKGQYVLAEDYRRLEGQRDELAEALEAAVRILRLFDADSGFNGTYSPGDPVYDSEELLKRIKKPS